MYLSKKPEMGHTLFSKINSYAFVFSLVTLLFLMSIRFVGLFIFGDLEAIRSNVSILDNFALVGLRFDLRVVGVVLILLVYLPFIFLFWLKNHRLYLSWVKVSLSFLLIFIVSISLIDIGYMMFFGTPIDILIFGLLQDDTMAVIESGVTDPFLIGIALIAPIIIYFLVSLFLKKSRNLLKRKPLRFMPKKAWLFFFLFPILFAAARGGVGTFSLSLKNSSVSSNSFINSLTQNAVFHLKYANKNRKENNFSKSSQKILAEAKVTNIQELESKAGFNKEYPLRRTTPQNDLLEKKPPHVVFVLMEGWSSHIALSDSNSVPVLGSFRQHAKQDYFLPHFFSNQNGTNPSVEALLLNSPLTPVGQSSAYKTVFSLSNVLPFKEKGYETQFLSGGYSSWRNHDVFWPRQGFDEYIGRSIIEAKYHVKSKNPWGVYDEYLFRYLEEELQNKDKPSFSFVLTTNNHPPVRLPPDFVPPDFDPTEMGFTKNIEHKKVVLSAYEYQTNAFGDFLTWLKSSSVKDNVIVIAVGDHPLRGFDDYTKPEKQYQRFSVPVYLYLPSQYDVLKQRPKTIVNQLYGSHVDLFPTLFELSLSNADYFAFGTSVTEKTIEDSYGWNYKKAFLVKEGFIDSRTQQLYSWRKDSNMLVEPVAQPISDKQRQLLEQEKYRVWLKEWLLYKDKEEQLP